MRFQLHWNKIEWINPRSTTKRNKPFSVSSKNHLNKNDRTYHWVDHSSLKELDTIDFFKITQIIEEMEYELTESSEMDLKTDNLAATKEADVDEAIPIYL